MKTNRILYLFVVLFIYSSFSCKKDKVELPVIETGTVTDIDGNDYRTVKIGNQWWMAENLRVTKFRNGTSIMQKQDDADWVNSSSAYCIYDNNQLAPGFLYNWHAVNDSNQLAPDGWHIPSDEEWKQLEKYLGMSQQEADKKAWRGTNEGEKLKLDGNKGWTAYGNVWATNESGFTALAGSCRLFNGTWGDPGLFATGFWWTSTGYDGGSRAWYRYLDYKNKNVFRSYSDINYGFNIRCVKDQ